MIDFSGSRGSDIEVVLGRRDAARRLDDIRPLPSFRSFVPFEFCLTALPSGLSSRIRADVYYHILYSRLNVSTVLNRGYVFLNGRSMEVVPFQYRRYKREPRVYRRERLYSGYTTSLRRF